MRRVLFLIADTGGGHRAAATAVERQMAASAPGEFEITILDPFTSAKPRVIGGTAGLYGPITRHARWLWGGLYYSTNSRSAVALLERTVLRSVTSAVTEAIDHLDPECVVSFHPLLNHISVRAVRSRARRIPVITVITDLVDIHVAWECRDVDAVVVPSRADLTTAVAPASPPRAVTTSASRSTAGSPSSPATLRASPRFVNGSACAQTASWCSSAVVRTDPVGSSSMRGRSPRDRSTSTSS
jgi:1,2-diacylglycerol 3-beta-galactosyltransferase